MPESRKLVTGRTVRLDSGNPVSFSNRADRLVAHVVQVLDVAVVGLLQDGAVGIADEAAGGLYGVVAVFHVGHPLLLAVDHGANVGVTSCEIQVKPGPFSWPV